MDLQPTQEDENRVEEGLVGNYTYLCHLDRSVHGLQPTQEDENRGRFGQQLHLTLSSRPECSWACGPPKGMKIGWRKVWSAITPTFVISTGAQRSGEICGFPHLAQRARQIWGTLDWWRFWIHTSSESRVPHPCIVQGWVTKPQQLAEHASQDDFGTGIPPIRRHDITRSTEATPRVVSRASSRKWQSRAVWLEYAAKRSGAVWTDRHLCVRSNPSRKHCPWNACA